MSHLEVLNLSKNKLTVIPDQIGKLAGLKELDVAQNNIQVISLEGLIQLTAIEKLNVSYNPLRKIPE